MASVPPVVGEIDEDGKRSRPEGEAETKSGEETGWTIRRPIRVEFRNLSVSVRVKSAAAAAIEAGPDDEPGVIPPPRQCCAHGQTVDQPILTQIDGVAEPGQLLAVMGHSGSGKTTLLNALSGRTTPNHGSLSVQLASPHGLWGSGAILLNGREASPQVLRAVSAYVQQEDIMLSTMTPRETVEFSSFLRLPASTAMRYFELHDWYLKGFGAREKLERSRQVLGELGLTHCQDTRIGGLLQRGISGGEKKRVNIGVEMVTDPVVLFVDEPTSGLDSATALTIVQLLKNLAKAGRTVICTIHSPSTKIFALFDRLLLLSQGQVAYLGPAPHALVHFAGLGQVCPAMTNPAEFLLRMLHVDGPEAKDRVARIAASYAEKPQLADPKNAAHLEDVVEAQLAVRHRPQLPFLQQMKHLTKRTWLHYVREPINTLVRVGENGLAAGFCAFHAELVGTVLLSLFVGLLYRNAGKNQRLSFFPMNH